MTTHSPSVTARWPRLWLAATVALVGLALSSLACLSSRPVPMLAPASTRTPGAIRLGEFEPVHGTRYMMAPMMEQPEQTGPIPVPEEYWRSVKGPIHNYVFFDPISETFHSLLPSNDYLVVDQQEPPEQDPFTKSLSVNWWIYQVVKFDTNGDKRLTSRDKLVLAVSTATGEGYTELATDIDEVLGMARRDANTLQVIFKHDTGYYLVRIDLPSAKVTQTTQIPSFGSAVK